MGFLSSAISKAKSYASTARSTYRTSRSSGGTRRASASRAVQNVGRAYARGGSRTARRIQRSKTAAAIRRVGSRGKTKTRKVPTTKTSRPKVPTGRHLVPSKAVIARETVSERLSRIPTVQKIRGVLEESKKHRPTMVGGLGVSAGGVLVTEAREQPAYKDLTHKELTMEEKARNLNVTLRQTLQPDVTKTRDYYNVLTEEEAMRGPPSGVGTATVPPSVTGKPDTKKKGGYWQSSQTFKEQREEIGLLGALGERQKALGATYIPTIGEYQKAVQTTPIVKDVFGAASKGLESKLSPERMQYGRDVSTALYGWGRSHPVTYVAEVGSMVALGPALKGVGYAAKGVKASRAGQFVGKGLGVTGSALGKVPVVGTVGRGLGYAGRGAVAVGKTRIPMTKMTVGGVTAQAALVGVPTYMTAQERKKITSTMDIDAAREQGLVVSQMKPLTEREVQIRKAEFDAAFIGHSAAFASGAALAPAAGSIGRGYVSKQKAFREAVGESKPIMYRDTIYSGQPQAPTGSLTSQVAKDIKQSLKESGHKVVDRDVFVPAKTVYDPQPFLGTEGKLVVSDLERGIYTGKMDIPSLRKMQASTQASKGEAVIESAYEKKLADFYEKKAIGGGRVIRRDADTFESMVGGGDVKTRFADDISKAAQVKSDIAFGVQYPKYAKLSKTMRTQQLQKGYEKLIDEAPIKISDVGEYRDIRRIKSEKTAKEAFDEWQDAVASKKVIGGQRHLLKKIDTIKPDTTVYPPFDEAYSRILPEARRQVRLQTTAEMFGERLPKLDTGEAWEIGETARLWKARHSATPKMTASEFIAARKQTIDPTELAYISELKRKVPRVERYAVPTEAEVAERVEADITYLTKKKDIIKYRQQQVDELLADSGEAVAERKAIIGERFGVDAPKTGGYVEPESGYWTPAQIKKTKKEMNIIFGADKPKPKPTAAKTPKGEQQGTGGMFYETPILETSVPKTKIAVKSRTKARETQWSRTPQQIVETPVMKPRTRTRMVSPFVAAQTGKQRQKDSPSTLTIPQMQTMGVMDVTQGKQMVRDILTQSGIQKTVTPTTQTTQQKTVTPVIQATTDITTPATPRRPKVPMTPTTITTPPPTAVPIPPYIPPPIIPFGLSGGGAAAAPTPTRKRGTQEFRKNPIASLFEDVAPEKKRKGKKEKKQESFSDMLAGAQMPTMITFGAKKNTKKRKK